jgi:CBS domain-containing protein
MHVRDIMQREVVTLELNDNLDLADDIMRLGRIRHLPVVSGGDVVGMVSQRDLYRAAVSSLLQLGRPAEHEWLARIPVRAVMTTRVFTVPPSASVRTAATILADKQIGCLPVVDDGTLVGLVSETDCLRHLARVLPPAETTGHLPGLPA